MSDVKDKSQTVLEDIGLIMVRPAETNLIYLGASKDVTRASSKSDRLYNEKLDQLIDSINNDSTVMLTRNPKENSVAAVFKVPKRGTRVTANVPNEVTGRPSNVVLSYSDLEYDKQQIANSDDPRDRLKARIMENIEKNFEEKIKEAERSGNKLDVEDIKHKKNMAWSIVKDEVDGKKKPRKEIEEMVQHAEDVTPDNVYVGQWKNTRPKTVNKIIDHVWASTDKYTDIDTYKMKSNVLTNASGNYTKDLNNFLDLKKNGGRYFTYDIETIGDALNSNRFSVVEIAAQGYELDKDGKYVQSKERFTTLIEMLPEERKEMSKIIDSLTSNKYSFNSLTGYQQRSIIDLMRYSSVDHSVEALKNLEHNPIIGQVYGVNEKVKKEFLFENMDEMLAHMKSGLENLRYDEKKDNVVVKATDAQDLFNDFVSKNQDATFVGHNSRRFDDRKLLEWNSGPTGLNMENKIVLPEKRIDFMNLVQATYADPRVLLEQLWDQSQGIKGDIEYEQGLTRLYEFQRALGLDVTGKHSALTDVADDGLGGVFAKSMDIIEADIKAAEVDETIKGVQKKGRVIKWSDTTLEEGQTLYADRGYTSPRKYATELTDEFDESFLAEWSEEESKFKRITNDFNSTIVNSKSFYEVQGIQELDNGKTALRLYDKELDRYSFIVRSGEDALEEIQDFVQSHFYNWDDGAKKTKTRILNKKQEDLARRRYDKMFSLDRSDMGRTGGYQSAKRYFEAARLYKQRQEGKYENLEQKALNNILERNKGLSMDKPKDLKRIKKLQKKEMNKLSKERISHEEFEVKMKEQFMTLWDAENKEWQFNKDEYEQFFKMKDRVVSEIDMYQPILNSIEREYGQQLEEAQNKLNLAKSDDEFSAARKKYADISHKMDVAFVSYANDLEKFADNLNPTKPLEKEMHQKRQFTIANGTGTRMIDAYDFTTAKRSVLSYAYQGLKNEKNADKKKQIAGERLFQMINEMDKSTLVSKDLINEMLDEAIKNPDVNNAINSIAQILSEAQELKKVKNKTVRMTNGSEEEFVGIKSGIKFEKELEVPDMGSYDPGLKVEADHLELLAQHNVEFSKTHINFERTGKTTPGQKFEFNSVIEEMFDKLDNIEHLSGIKPNNRIAVENLLENILDRKNGENRPIAFSLDKATNNLIVSVGKGSDNTEMLRQLMEGKLPTNAVNLHVPLIGQSGTHRVGERILNARTYMDYDPKQGFSEKSSTEMIVDNYNKNMKKILNQLDFSELQYAQDTARKSLNNATKELAGIQRGSTSFSDTNYFSNNQADLIKQSHVDIQSALIKQLYHQGLGTYKLERGDFKEPDKVFNEDGGFKGVVGYDDLNMRSQYNAAMAIEDFIDKNGFELYVSGMKDDDHAGEKLSRIDARDLGPYRDFVSQTRANSIQAANASALDQDVVAQLNSIYKSGGAYVTTKQHVTTDMQQKFLEHWNDIRDVEGNQINKGKILSFDMKVMYMNDTDIHQRLQWMATQDKGIEILKKENMLMLDDDGSIMLDEKGHAKFDPSAVARVYEQQITMSSDVAGALKTNQTKIYHDIEVSKDLINKVKSGEKISGRQLLGHDASGEAVYWEKDVNKKATAQIIDNKVIMNWDEDVFKLQVGGEKGTINAHSAEFLEMLTGSREVAAVMNPNVLKHKDMGMLYESKAGLFGQKALEYIRTGNKQGLADLNEDVKSVGLEWDAENLQYKENAKKYFKHSSLDVSQFAKIAENHGIESNIELDLRSAVTDNLDSLLAQKETLMNTIKQDQANPIITPQKLARNNLKLKELEEEITLAQPAKKFEVGVLNTIASAVTNYSRVTDGTGYEVLGFNEAGLPIHATSKGNRSVTWGHRELNALTQKGLKETSKKMIEKMLEQGRETEDLHPEDRWVTQYLNDKGTRINRIQETHNMMEAIERMLDPSKVNSEEVIKLLDNEQGLKLLPEYRSDVHTLQKTIFDKDFIMNNIKDEYRNNHGYWLELPSIKNEDGTINSVEINIDGVDSKGSVKQKQNTNRIFVPYTNLEGANGEVHLRALQKSIADIHRRADEVGNSTNRTEAMKGLQEAVDNYTKQLVYDVTSSKGQFGRSVGRINMSSTASGTHFSSANGLFKLIDPFSSLNAEGETTFINRETAKKLGVLDKLDNGGEMFVMNNRFPTFHQDAMQVTKLKIGENIKDGEFHTTAFFSDLLAADSDGDYDNLVVSTDDKIQEEWAEHYRQQEEALKAKAVEAGYSESSVLGGKPATGSRTFGIEGLAEELSQEAKKNKMEFDAGAIMEPNTQSEIASKIGKKTIGLASNLNLQLRHVAMEYFAHDQEMQDALFTLGQTVEQKLISSKHGVNIETGRAPAMELIQAIQKSGTSAKARVDAFNIANEFFSDMKGVHENLAKAMEGIQIAQQQSSAGINNIGYNAGTSGGISAREGLRKIYDVLRGNVDPADVTTSNSFTNMLRHLENERKPYEESERPREYQPNQNVQAMKETQEQNLRQMGKIKEGTRKAKATLREKAKAVGEIVNNTPNLRKGLIAGGIALGGIGLYNIASKDNPIPEMNKQSQDSPVYDAPVAKPSRSPLPSISQDDGYGGSQAVNVNISAQGSNSINKAQVGGMVSNSLNQSGVSSTGANMHITQRDNTQNLNQIWYRDKVQENI